MVPYEIYYYLFYLQWSWATNPLSDVKVGVYGTNDEEYCSASSSGTCTRRFDVVGTFSFSSGIVVKSNKLEFSGNVIVKESQDLQTKLNVFVKGIPISLII